MTLDGMAIGFCGALATVLQTRLMDVAGDAQNLAAALNHSSCSFKSPGAKPTERQSS